VRRFGRAAVGRFWRDESGGYLVVAGLVMPAMVGVIGLATEGGAWYLKHRTMQNAADSAAISAATAYYTQGNATGLDVQAQAVTAAYGLVNGTNNVTVTTNQPPATGPNVAVKKAVEVIISQPQNRLFSALWGSGTVGIQARAVAVGMGGKGCVVSLDKTDSGATTTIGSATVNLNSCSLYDNSSSPSALSVGGSSTISAESVNVVGGISGGSGISTTDGTYTGQSPIDDPYASTPNPSFSGCAQTNYSDNSKNPVTLNPGVYCGGMKLNANANVTLNPGTYYLDGGSLDVAGGATMTGTGVTLVFTSSSGSNYATANVNGGATLNLSAPTTGTYAGIVIYGDRGMPAGTSLKFNGGASEVFQGAVYVPEGNVQFAGGAASNGCLQLIAYQVNLTGNSNFAVNCTGSGTKPIGSALATLAE
jgi:Flp pilus assembly protein TadG